MKSAGGLRKDRSVGGSAVDCLLGESNFGCSPTSHPAQNPKQRKQVAVGVIEA